jgi:hypothetical protein
MLTKIWEIMLFFKQERDTWEDTDKAQINSLIPKVIIKAFQDYLNPTQG